MMRVDAGFLLDHLLGRRYICRKEISSGPAALSDVGDHVGRDAGCKEGFAKARGDLDTGHSIYSTVLNTARDR